MRKIILTLALVITAMGSQAQSKVYFTRDITPESLVKIYEALGVEAKGRVAVKISTGEAGNTHYLKPTLIRNLVERVNGTIVECCTAYGGSRQDVSKHWQTIHEHGFDSIFAVDIMDEYDQIRIPIQDRKHLKYDIVGGHLANYDFMINLAHFKGHGKTDDASKAWGPEYLAAGPTQDLFLESMAAAAQSVHNYMGGRVVYINVMNNMSVDCDCDGHPAKPELKDMGILASLDPVAVDQACLDKVFNYQGKKGDDNKPLIQRINRQHGTYITDYAEKIGLGSKQYVLIDLDRR